MRQANGKVYKMIGFMDMDRQLRLIIRLATVILILQIASVLAQGVILLLGH